MTSLGRVLYVAPYSPWGPDFGGRMRVRMIWQHLQRRYGAELIVIGDDVAVADELTRRSVRFFPARSETRVQRLTRDGFILGYEARLDPQKLDAGMLVFVEVLLDRTTPNVFEQFKVAVQLRPEIMECHMVAGGFDYLLKIRCADMEAYRHFAGTLLWQLPGVRETRTYAVMEEVKHTTHVPLPGL